MPQDIYLFKLLSRQGKTRTSENSCVLLLLFLDIYAILNFSLMGANYYKPCRYTYPRSGILY